MSRTKFAINTGTAVNCSFEEALDVIRSTGFDGCFTGCRDDGSDILEKAAMIDKKGLIYQSVHSQFGRVHTIWEEGEEGEHQTDLLIRCVNECEKAGVPILIIHPIIGMDRHTPTDLGTARFARLVEAAEKTSVKLAFENVESLEYLDKVFAYLGSSSSVGLCWDTGHEMCYNFSTDIPGRFPGKLIATHFNDNLGIADVNDVTWLDDLHLAPFDGIADWKGIMDRIRREKFDGILTFELTRENKPGKNTHAIYDGLDNEQFFSLIYERACKIIAL